MFFALVVEVVEEWLLRLVPAIEMVAEEVEVALLGKIIYQL
jgi:hypothetical protein